MKKNIILTAVIIVIAFVSNINAQTKPNIVKFGFRNNNVVMEYERRVTPIFSAIGGIGTRETSLTEDYSLGFKQHMKVKRKGTTNSMLVGGRLYFQTQKEGWNFYLQPNVQIERFSGTEQEYDNSGSGFLLGVTAAVISGNPGYLGNGSNSEPQPLRDKRFKSMSFIGALNVGAQFQRGAFVFDVGIGFGRKTNRQHDGFGSGEIKLGYAF